METTNPPPVIRTLPMDKREALLKPDWQPIESAPRDELVWLFEPHDDGGFMFAGLRGGDGAWVNNLDFREQSPTYWMPLPAAPTTPTEEHNPTEGVR